MKKIQFILLKCLIFLTVTNAQEKSTIGSIEQLKPEMSKLISIDNEIEILAKGFEWSEGPVWVNELNAILFSDVPSNKIYKWDESNGLKVFMEPSGYTGVVPNNTKKGSNGLVINEEGQLVLCMVGDRRVSRLSDFFEKKFIPIITNFKGNLFNSPNDLVYAENGDLFFTDPPGGLLKKDDDELKELPFNGVFKLTKSGVLSLVIKNLTRPNGIGISKDQKTLYVSNSDPNNPIIMSYEILPDGVKNPKVFFDGKELSKKYVGNFDGLKVHPGGAIFSTGPGGVLIISKDGEHLGTIKTSERTSNCNFDNDYNYLYMTTDMYLTRVKL